MKEIEEIRNRITNVYPSLTMKRVPQNTYDEFKKYAEDEFCSDYGMAFKSVWDVAKGAVITQNQELWAAIDDLNNKFEMLNKKEEETKVRRTLGGREI